MRSANSELIGFTYLQRHWKRRVSEFLEKIVLDRAERLNHPAANPLVLHGHEEGVTAVAISPDNR